MLVYELLVSAEQSSLDRLTSLKFIYARYDIKTKQYKNNANQCKQNDKRREIHMYILIDIHIYINMW